MVFLKKTKSVLILLVLLVLSVLIVHGLRRSNSENSQGSVMLKCKNFETKNSAFDFTFEYPDSGWSPVETAGRTEKYDLVYLQGPTEKETGFTNIIHITVRPLGAGKTARELLEAYLKMESNLREFKLLGKKTIKIGGLDVPGAFYGYAVSLPRSDMKSDLVPIKSAMMFFVRNDRSYEITFSAFASKYDFYAPVLERVLKTFKFKQ